jgi:AcrR family transcriptional regulator
MSDETEATTGTERRRRSDAISSRAALLEAARSLFAERGPEALTVVEVARRAGLNRSTAYQHFKTRDDLVRAVGDAFAREVRALFARPRTLGDQIESFVHYIRGRPDISRLWMYYLLGDRNENAAGWEDYIRAMERLASSPKTRDGIDPEMLGVIGMTSALVWSLMVRQRTDSNDAALEQTQRFARELKRLFLFGALRPEDWPELTAEFEETPDEG